MNRGRVFYGNSPQIRNDITTYLEVGQTVGMLTSPNTGFVLKETSSPIIYSNNADELTCTLLLE